MSTEPVRFVLVGGFLGAGKTTAMTRLARMSQSKGRRVGLITNDQADDLVDTRTLKAQGFAVEQVAGACFCCHFNAMTDAARALVAEHRPQVILAEPVGSCTDLVATVIRPLMTLYPGEFELAPYAVLLKPEHARLLLDGDQTAVASDASYIFRKQLEEADLIAINKADALSTEEIERLTEYAKSINPDAPVLAISAKTGQGFDDLLARIDDRQAVASRVLSLDYDRYARGEAELGWLNGRFEIKGNSLFSLDGLLSDLASRLEAGLNAQQAEPAHLKISAQTGSAYGVINWVDGRKPSELSVPSGGQANGTELTVNARVAIDPDILERTVCEAVSGTCAHQSLDAEVQSMRSLRPGRPVPIHRLFAVGGPNSLP